MPQADALRRVRQLGCFSTQRIASHRHIEIESHT